MNATPSNTTTEFNFAGEANSPNLFINDQLAALPSWLRVRKSKHNAARALRAKARIMKRKAKRKA